MKLEFTKMHGTGNDYVYINCMGKSGGEIFHIVQNAEFISHRRFGVGSDGIILICASEVADFKMIMYNADGSEGKMCGNGIRCVGKYVYDKKLTNSKNITIETKSGVKNLELSVLNNSVDYVSVEMGKIELEAKKIPVLLDKNEVINVSASIGGDTYNITCVSMGNPHCVIFTKSIEKIHVDEKGRDFAGSGLFPEGINVEFVVVKGGNILEMRVYERGSGETMSCGTGACAAAAASVLNGFYKYDEEIMVCLPGGKLYVVCRSDKTILLRGEAKIVFEGIIFI